MKNQVYLTILLLIVAVFIGWFLFKQSDVDVSNTSKLQVTVSLPLLRNLTEEIGRDEVSVISIINGPSCNHEYEPTSGDLKRVSGCAVFVKAGLGFDLWADKLIAAAGQNILVIDASHGVAVIKDEHEEHEEHDDHEHKDETGHEAEHHHGPGNPHYWGSPANVKIMAGNILEGLIKALPEKKEYFSRNYQAYISKIDRTAEELKVDFAKVSSKKIVSYSAAFPYFFRYFGLDNLATVENTCEQEVSPKHLTEVIKIMKANNVKVLIGDAVYPKLPRNLAKETGAELVLLWPATNESGDYLKTLRENAAKLVSALQ